MPLWVASLECYPRVYLIQTGPFTGPYGIIESLVVTERVAITVTNGADRHTYESDAQVE